MRVIPAFLAGASLAGAQLLQGPSSSQAASSSPATSDSGKSFSTSSTTSVSYDPAGAAPTFALPDGISDAATEAESLSFSVTSGASSSTVIATATATANATTEESPKPNSTTSAACTFCTVPAGYTSEDIPAPIGVTKHFNSKWREAHAKAADFLKDWTVQDKVKLVTGSGWLQDRCVGNTAPVPDRNWTGLCLQDSPLGVRFGDYVTAFPAGINVASTFDKELMYLRGKALGEEFRGKGVNVVLGPMTNMGRVAAGGRNWEGFGGDPYLSGEATYYTIKGMQKVGVQACVKHYIGNEEERNRHTSSSNLDDRTLHEVYLHPFLRAVQADVASFMCSYNLVNGSWACQNSKTQNGILKTELGFEGYVLSDWDGTHSGVLAVNNGLDMTMPGDIGMSGNQSDTYFGQHLVEALNNGSISSERFDDMAQRVLAGWFLVGQDQDYPAVNFNSWTAGGPNNSHVDVRGDHEHLVRHIGASSTVLLKNLNNTLPLQKPRSIAVIGSDMGPSDMGPNGYMDRGGDRGTLAMGWGSGTTNFPYLVDPLEALSIKARKDHTVLNWWLRDWDVRGAATAAAKADIAIVGVNADSGEEYITVDGNIGDRNNLSAWNNGDELVKAVAAVNRNTIVVVHSVGPMLMEPWIDHPNVTAVLWAGLPGQESGSSLVDVMYGDYNPSGRLPYTIARNRSDYSADITYVPAGTGKENDVFYKEGLFIDYRHFLAKGIKPRFPFGYGGSYTSFAYSDVAVSSVSDYQARHDDEEDDPDHGRSVKKELHKTRYTVTASIKNTGAVNGCEVPQLYISFPPDAGEPPRVLRDFTRINLDPGACTEVTFNLSTYDLSIWDVVTQRWAVPDGQYTAIVARHSFDDDGVSATFCPGHC